MKSKRRADIEQRANVWSWWIAERLAPLLAMQVTRVRSQVPAGPMISVEKVALLCNPVSATRFSSTTIEIMKRFKICMAKRQCI
jgi:hypothetical protein